MTGVNRVSFNVKHSIRCFQPINLIFNLNHVLFWICLCILYHIVTQCNYDNMHPVECLSFNHYFGRTLICIDVYFLFFIFTIPMWIGLVWIKRCQSDIKYAQRHVVLYREKERSSHRGVTCTFVTRQLRYGRQTFYGCK